MSSDPEIFDPNLHRLVCVERETGRHFHVDMAEFSRAEAQFEQPAGNLSDEEILERFAALESRGAVAALPDLSGVDQRIGALETALAHALRHIEALTTPAQPAPADTFIEPPSWPVEASTVVMPAPPPVPPPGRPLGRKAKMAEAMRRVEEAEAFDAPLPEYHEPPAEPTARDVFEPAPQPLRQRLDAAVRKAQASLIEDRTLYDIAVMASHENKEQESKLTRRAKRRGVSVKAIADEIIQQWRGCELAFTDVLNLSEDALDAMTDRPGESEAIVNRAIRQIEQKVGDATAYRT
jgi:hypothetical protein